MFKNILNFFKNKDEVVEYGNEYDLLIKNNRIVDFSNEQDRYQIDLKIGFYLDTFRYLTKNLNDDTQAKNIKRVLTTTYENYLQLLKGSYGVDSTQKFLDKLESTEYQRIQHLYEVNEIKLPKGKTSDTFCINFLVRPKETSFLLIGKKPKGKITSAQRADARKNYAKNWEEFKHL